MHHSFSIQKKSKKMLACSILFACIMQLSYAGNGMTIIPLSSPIYDYVENLYILEGHAAPQGSKPWTEADARQQLSRIEPKSETSKYLIEQIETMLSDETDRQAHMEVGMNIAPALAVHCNTKDFGTSEKWANDVLNGKLVRLDGGLYVSDYLAANMGLSLGFEDTSGSKASNSGIMNDVSSESRFNEVFSTNIPFISHGSIDMDFSDSSFFSLGNPYVSVALARGQLSLGNGAMGNLILGNTLPYHDYISLAASNNTWFDYSLLLSFYTHPMNYANASITDELHGLQLFIAHRFEFRMLADKLRITMNEALMYQSEESRIDFRVFNPLLIMHGFFIPSNANSIFSMEIEYAPVRNMQMYFSFVIDDLALPGAEPQPPEIDSTLNMWGLMGGIRATTPYRKGYFRYNLEAVYISPLTYHKDCYGSAVYSLDFIGSIRLADGTYVREYLSFPFGSDALAFLGEISYTIPNGWSAGTKLFYMAHGVTDKNSIAKKYDGSNTEVPGFLMTSNPFDESETGKITHSFVIGLEGEYQILDNLSISSSIDFIAETDERTAFDLQWTLGMKYSIF